MESIRLARKIALGRSSSNGPDQARGNDAPSASYMRQGELEVATKFKVGDQVSWNSEAGRVSGKIVRVHTRDFDYKGHTHRASEDDSQYEIKSDKTEHVAVNERAMKEAA
jgi:hypothetical protein